MNLNIQPAPSNPLCYVMGIGGVYQGVVDYLTPIDLYNLTNTCKDMHSNSNLNVKTIVKVALLNGNKHTKTTIEHIYHQLLPKAIFTPSVHRLLLLTVIRSCELCGNNKIQYVTNFGLAFCNDCRKLKTTSCHMKPPKRLQTKVEINDLLQHPNVLSIVHHFERESCHQFSPKQPVSFVLKKPAFSGKHERIGPIITDKDLNAMLKLSNYKLVENYISVHQPPSHSQNFNDRNDFINAVNTYREVSYRAQTLRGTKNREAWKTYRMKKIQNALQALENLMEFIPPDLNNNTYFGHSVDHFYRDYQRCSYRVCIYMNNPFVRNKLRPLLRAPSRYLTITQKNHEELLHLARILCRHFSALRNPQYAATL